MMETRLEVLRVGADDYIIKPFDLDEVLVRIEVVLRRTGAPGAGDNGVPAGVSKGMISGNTKDYNGLAGSIQGAASGGGSGNNLTAVKITSADGKLVIYVDENRAAYEDRNLTLTAKELALLQLFLQYPTKTFTKVNLYETVWNDTYYYEDNTINVHMSNLRSKLKKQTGNDYIETVWGIGYRLKERDM
ncbi:MAG: response regulator transcription factor [Lachnospiraceae bacterium]|nr:response regulator transcription factor [Lachnospiraceae bacterium]